MDSTSTALPLDIDLNSIDTSFPLIAGGNIVDFLVEKIEASTGGTPPAPMLKITLKSTTPTTSVKGDNLEPGVTLFHNIMLAATGKATGKMVAQNIAEFAQGTGITGSLGDFINGGYMQGQGKTARVKVTYTPEGPDKKGIVRKARNEVGSFIRQ